jgi:hypothetical protein
MVGVSKGSPAADRDEAGVSFLWQDHTSTLHQGEDGAEYEDGEDGRGAGDVLTVDRSTAGDAGDEADDPEREREESGADEEGTEQAGRLQLLDDDLLLHAVMRDEIARLANDWRFSGEGRQSAWTRQRRRWRMYEARPWSPASAASAG